MDDRDNLKRLFEEFMNMKFPHYTGGNKRLGEIMPEFAEWDSYIAGLVTSFIYHDKVKKKWIYAHEGMGPVLDVITPKSREEKEALDYFKRYNSRLDEMLSLLKRIIEEEKL